MKSLKKGECDTNFIADNPQLFDITARSDEEYRILKFIGEKVVNETKGKKKEYDVPDIPNYNFFRWIKWY